MYKKVWIYILIIVVVSTLFPSILIANAEEGEIPDLEYSLQDAPFPGTYENLTESNWQAFLDNAELLNHTAIYKLTSYTIYYENADSETKMIEEPVFFSSDGTDIEHYNYIEDNRETTPEKWYIWAGGLIYTDLEKRNEINKNGHNTHKAYIRPELFNAIFASSKSSPVKWNPGTKLPINITVKYEVWYSAEAVNDPYQGLPEQYNIDPSKGYGMWFTYPEQGEYINIPYEGYRFKEVMEIFIHVPQDYIDSEGNVQKLFNVKGTIGQIAEHNFMIKLYTKNVYNIEASKIRGDLWIRLYNVDFIEGIYDGQYMESAVFRARVPIEHAYPMNGESSLIVADLYHYDYDYVGDQSWDKLIPEARTWVRYLYYIGTIDSDGDGYDDRTGHKIYKYEDYFPEKDKSSKPNREDYDDGILGTISYYFDTLIYYAKLPFEYIGIALQSIIDWISNIGTFIESFTSIFERLFSFLPAEVNAMLVLGFSAMMIITIVRAIRGS